MFVATYWWVFLLVGVALVGSAVYRQSRFINSVGSKKTWDRLQARLEGKPDQGGGFFQGFFLTALFGLTGSLSLLLGLIGLVVTLVKG